jgi:hypothetical protein
MSLASNLPTPVRRTVMRASRGVVRLTKYKDRSELAFRTDNPASPTEPHEISIDTLRSWLKDFKIEMEDEWSIGHAGEDVPGHAVVVVATRP